MKSAEQKRQVVDVFLFLLPIFLVVWIRSGRGMPERWMFLIFALYYMGYMLWKAIRHGVKRWGVRLIKDPLLYCGGGFIALLGVQLWNSGRTLVFNREVWEWEYGLPPHPGWPSAIDAVEAQQWLFVALMVVLMLLVVRSVSFSRYQYRWMLKMLLYNAVLLVVFGFIQYVSGTKKQYGFHYLPGYFFSVFGYPNHAASFFVLLFGVGCGFLADAIRPLFAGARMQVRRVGVYCGSTLCCGVGAILSLSRAGMLLLAGQLVVCVVYFVRQICRFLTPTKRVNALLLIGVMLLIFSAAIMGVAKDKIEVEMKRAVKELSITKLVNPPPKSLTGIRYPFWVAAVKVWKDYPVYGCGSWGFRYLKKLYIPREEWKTAKGYANVHLDGLQFLAEYGVIGFGLMLAGTGVLFWGAFGWAFWRNALYLFVFIGLCAVLVHSLIDLPFRCPAVSSHWLLIVSVMGRLRSRLVD